MKNLDSILKSRDITFLTKVCLVKAMVFPVDMYGCESWTIKKADHWRTDAFKPWCWQRLLRVPWFSRRSNQSILKEINPEYSLEGLMLKLKIQYFGHLVRRYDSLEKTLMLGSIEGRRRKGWERMRWLDDVTDSVMPGVLQSMGLQRARHDWVTEQQHIHTWLLIYNDDNGIFMFIFTLSQNATKMTRKEFFYKLEKRRRITMGEQRHTDVPIVTDLAESRNLTAFWGRSQYVYEEP